MTRYFSQNEKEAAAELDPEINQRLAAHFDVPTSRVHSVELATDGEYHYADDERGVQLLDFVGYDKVVDLTERVVPVAQRVRESNDEYDVDFALRMSNGRGKPAEYDKILNAWRDGGAYPTVYAHAVRRDDTLTEFVLVDVDALCEAITEGRLIGQGPYTASFGVQLRFYSIDGLRSKGCVLTEWSADD